VFQKQQYRKANISVSFFQQNHVGEFFSTFRRVAEDRYFGSIVRFLGQLQRSGGVSSGGPNITVYKNTPPTRAPRYLADRINLATGILTFRNPDDTFAH
jgi:hypothetical protein